MITCSFTCIPIRIPLQYNEAYLYELYDKFLVHVALSTQQKTLASNLSIISIQVSVIWMLKLFLSTSFAVLTWVFFVTLPRRDVQKGTLAYMKQSKGSKTYILLLPEIGWGTLLQIGRPVSPTRRV